jgi:hypothetical protein
MVRRQIMLRCRATPKASALQRRRAKWPLRVTNLQSRCNIANELHPLRSGSECDSSPEFSFAAQC